jgi:hypothetical protein
VATLNSTADILMQALLARNESGDGSNGASPAEMLAQLAQSNPRMAPIVRHLQERLAGSSRNVDTVPEKDETASEIAKKKKKGELPGHNRELESLAEKMFAELEALRARNDMLATALGACHLCWGEDQECSYCNGAGRVGAYVINRNLFEQAIGPAVCQLRRRPQLAKTQTLRKGENYGGA